MVAGDILDPGGESDKLMSHTHHHTCLPYRRIAATLLTPRCTAGVPEAAVQRFGRWTSEAYKAYVYAHADSLNAQLQKSVHLVPPRFERN